MWDLYQSIAIMIAVSGCAFFCVKRWSRRFRQGQRTLLSLIVVALGALYLIFVRDHVFMARLFPFSGLIVLGQWLPIFCLALAGLTWNTPGQDRRRKLVPVLALSCVAGFVTVHPLLGRPPECSSTWDGDVCLQSSWYTCSAASAATLLKHHGIDATEEQLAELCLTRKGTTWQGLFRGLNWMTRDTEWKVLVASPTVEQLAEQQSFPVIISVGIPRGISVDPIYAEQYGWPAGLLHSVVLLGFKA